MPPSRRRGQPDDHPVERTVPVGSLPSNAITKLPTTLQPRRKRLRQTPGYGPVKRRRNTEKPGNCPSDKCDSEKGTSEALQQTSVDDATSDALFSNIANMADTHVAALTLRSQWPQEAASQLERTPPLVLRSQLYALISDTITVDSQLSKLVLDGTLRHIFVPSTRNPARRHAYVFTEDFVLRSPYDGPIFQKFFTLVFKGCPHPTVEQTILNDVYEDEKVNDATSLLIQAGYLVLADDSSYHFTVPGMGKVMNDRASGESELLAILKRAPYREMSLLQLEQRTMKKSIFTAQWHVRDLIGSGTMTTVPTVNMGTMVRLPHSTQ